MRWQRLFDDLEARLDGEELEAFDAEVADRTRGELAATTLEDRLRGATGRDVVVDLFGAGKLTGMLRRVGSGWLIVDEPQTVATIVVLSAISGVRDLPVVARPRTCDGVVGARAGVGHVLRVLARDRIGMSVVLVDGTRISGTIDRVGADYFDLAQHPLDEPRRSMSVRSIRTIAFAGTATLRASR